LANDANKAIIIGNLTRDPELKYTQTGIPVAKLTIANNRTYYQGEEKKEKVSYFSCIAWKKKGETICQYAKKGDKMYIEGRLDHQTWKNDEGKHQSKYEIIVGDFQFLTPKTGQPSQPAASAQSAAPAMDDNPFSDDDIPF